MRNLTSFQFITLDGYYKDINNDITWHKHGQEEGEYSSESLIDPVANGNGTSLFNNIRHQLDLKLTDTRTFKSVVLLCYEPV